jgi:ABC-type phosphate transport system substrate-binding protein
MTVPSSEKDPRVTQLITFVLSPEGQAILDKAGTVNLESGKNLWPKYQQMASLTR